MSRNIKQYLGFRYIVHRTKVGRYLQKSQKESDILYGCSLTRELFLSLTLFLMISYWFYYLDIILQTRQTVEKLQSLISSDGRFRNLRDSLHRTDPPCIPYLGMYLSDLTFIEEGTPNFTDNGLLNFAKMRMVMFV